MSRNPWAYAVTPEQRRREVAENEQTIAQVGAVEGLLARLTVDPAWLAEGLEPHLLALTSPEAAQAMGITPEEAREVAALCEQDPAWVMALPGEVGPGWYKRAEALCQRLEATYGRHVYGLEFGAKLLKDAKRRLRTARKALEG